MDSLVHTAARFFDTLRVAPNIQQHFLNEEVLCSKDGKAYTLLQEQKEMIESIEKYWNCKVWHVISHTAYDADNNRMEIDCYLTCAENDVIQKFAINDDNDKYTTGTYISSAYSYCKNIPAYSEFCPALIQQVNGVLERIYG